MDEKRKKLLDDILVEAEKTRLEERWLVTENELAEHSGIRDSFEFGFLCGYLRCKEKMMMSAVECRGWFNVGGSEHPMYGAGIRKQDIPQGLKIGDKVKLIIIKEG